MKPIITLAIITIILSGCVSSGPTKLYQGPDRQLTELSVISNGSYVKITAIDENEVNCGKQFCKYAVIPGKHTVTYQYYKKVGSNEIFIYNKLNKVVFTTNSGNTYMLAASYPKDEFLFWLIEKDVNGKSTDNDIKYKTI